MKNHFVKRMCPHLYSTFSFASCILYFLLNWPYNNPTLIGHSYLQCISPPQCHKQRQSHHPMPHALSLWLTSWHTPCLLLNSLHSQIARQHCNYYHQCALTLFTPSLDYHFASLFNFIDFYVKKSAIFLQQLKYNLL